LAEKIQKL